MKTLALLSHAFIPYGGWGRFSFDGKGQVNMSVEIDVEKVANLAKLSLAEDEKSMQSELEEILVFADKLAEIDTNGVDVTAHIVPITNVLRADEITNHYNREEILSNAPTKADGYMTVPKTFE